MSTAAEAARRSIVVVHPRNGGAGAFAATSVDAMRDSGWTVHPLVLGADDAPARVARRALSAHRGLIEKADLLHVEFGCLDLSAFWFAAIAPRVVPLVVVAHDAPRVALAPGSGLIRNGSRFRDVAGHRFFSPLLDRALNRAVARKAAAAVVLSNAASDAWRVFRPRHVVVAEHGADPPSARRPHASNGAHILFAGHIGESKGLDVLLDAWKLIGAASSLPLVIAGSGATVGGSTYEAELRALSARLPRPPQWTGHLDDARFADVVASSAIVVLPYRRSNPASGVLVRAMVEGRAIVATRVPAARSTLVDGETGLLVDIDDPQALAEALLRLARDAALRDRLGVAAAAAAARRFTWPRYLMSLEHAYRLATEQ